MDTITTVNIVNLFLIPNVLYPLVIPPPFQPSLLPHSRTTTDLISITLVYIAFSWLLYKWKLIVQILFYSTFMAEHIYCEIHSYYCVHYFPYHCMDIPQFAYPFTHGGTVGLLTVWDIINKVATNIYLFADIYFHFSRLT